MPYEVLAQKWRPQCFSEVVGQKHVITTLKNQILNDKVGHAYLFSGPRGTGKTTVARILAKAVNCTNRKIETEFTQEESAEPCNECDTCVAISNGKAFDVTEMDAASNRGIDEIRGLRERVKLAPSSCQYKVYIIDEAHMLTPEAFNALLKTLEEPPEYVIFILITTERHRIPKTILSRCQDFEFWYLSHSQIISHLKKLCKSEGFSVTEEGLGLIAQKSEGCLRDAQNLLEQLFAASGENKEINLDDVSRLLGFGSISLLNKLVEQIIDQNVQNCLEIVNQLAEQGADLSQSLRTLITDFRSLRLIRVSTQLTEIIDASETRLEWMKSQTENVSLERISKILKILMKAENDIKQHGYELINFESALIEACLIQEGIELAEAFDKLTEIQGKLEEMSQSQKSVIPFPKEKLNDEIYSAKPALDSEPSKYESGSEEEKNRQFVYPLHGPYEPLSELSPGEIVTRLTNLLNNDEKGDLITYIEEGAKVEVEDSKLIFKFPSPFYYDILKDEKKVIAKLLEKIAGGSEVDEKPIRENNQEKLEHKDSTKNYTEDQTTDLTKQETPEFSEDVDDEIPVVDNRERQPSKGNLFEKAHQDKIISYAIRKFKAGLIEVKPR